MPKKLYSQEEQLSKEFIQREQEYIREHMQEYLIPEDEKSQQAFVDKFIKEDMKRGSFEENVAKYLQRIVKDFNTVNHSPEELPPKTMHEMYRDLVNINYLLSLDNADLSPSVDGQFPPESRSAANFKKNVNRLWTFLTGISRRMDVSSMEQTPAWYMECFFKDFDFDGAYRAFGEDELKKQEEAEKKAAEEAEAARKEAEEKAEQERIRQERTDKVYADYVPQEYKDALKTMYSEVIIQDSWSKNMHELGQHNRFTYRFPNLMTFYFRTLHDGKFIDNADRDTCFRFLGNYILPHLWMTDSNNWEEQFPEKERTPENFQKKFMEVWDFLKVLQAESNRREKTGQRANHMAGEINEPEVKELYQQFLKNRQKAAEAPKAAEDVKAEVPVEDPKANAPEEAPKKKQLMKYDASVINSEIAERMAAHIQVGHDALLNLNGPFRSNLGYRTLNSVFRTWGRVEKSGNFASRQEMENNFRDLAKLMTFLRMNDGKREEELFPENVRTPELFCDKVREMTTFMDVLLKGDYTKYAEYQRAAVDEMYHSFRENYEIPEHQPDAKRAAEVQKDLTAREERVKQKAAEEERQNQLKMDQENARKEEERKQREKEEERKAEEARKQREEEQKRLEEEDRRKNPEKYEKIDQKRRKEKNEEDYRKQFDAIAQKVKKLRTKEEELKTAGTELTKRLPGYEIPADQKQIEEGVQAYLGLLPEWKAFNLNVGGLNDKKESFIQWVENYGKVQEHPEQFDAEMYEKLGYVCDDLGMYRRRSDEATLENYLAVSAECYALLKALTDNMKDDKCFYNYETGCYYKDVFNEAYSSYKGLKPVDFHANDEAENEAEAEEQENEAQPVQAEQNPQVQAAPAQPEAAQQAVAAQPEVPQQAAPVQPEAAQQAAPAEAQDPMKEALKQFEVAANASIWGRGGHPTEFGNVRSLVAAYQNPGDQNRNVIAQQLYRACRVYMDRHTDNGRTQNDIGGQNSIGGRLRKQAIVQILRTMNDHADDPTFANLDSDYQRACREENREPQALELDALEGSLAYRSKEKPPRGQQYTVRQKAYAELKTATTAFRDTLARRQAEEERRRQEAQQRREREEQRRREREERRQRKHQPHQPK